MPRATGVISPSSSSSPPPAPATGLRPGPSIARRTRRDRRDQAAFASKGDLAPGLDPARLATSYVSGGAAALSVLTDVESFGRSPTTWPRPGASGLPVLRKDFTVAEADVADARLMGPTPSC